MNLSTKARVYVIFLGLLALAASAYYVRDIAFLKASQALAFVVFLVLGFLSEVYAVWIPAYGFEVSSSIAIYMASLFILGPSGAVLLVFLSTLAPELLMRWDHLKSNPGRFAYVLIFNVSQLVVTVAVTGLIFFKLRGAPLTLASMQWASTRSAMRRRRRSTRNT